MEHTGLYSSCNLIDKCHIEWQNSFQCRILWYFPNKKVNLTTMYNCPNTTNTCLHYEYKLDNRHSNYSFIHKHIFRHSCLYNSHHYIDGITLNQKKKLRININEQAVHHYQLYLVKHTQMENHHRQNT